MKKCPNCGSIRTNFISNHNEKHEVCSQCQRVKSYWFNGKLHVKNWKLIDRNYTKSMFFLSLMWLTLILALLLAVFIGGF